MTTNEDEFLCGSLLKVLSGSPFFKLPYRGVDANGIVHVDMSEQEERAAHDYVMRTLARGEELYFEEAIRRYAVLRRRTPEALAAYWAEYISREAQEEEIEKRPRTVYYKKETKRQETVQVQVQDDFDRSVDLRWHRAYSFKSTSGSVNCISVSETADGHIRAVSGSCSIQDESQYNQSGELVLFSLDTRRPTQREETAARMNVTVLDGHRRKAAGGATLRATVNDVRFDRTGDRFVSAGVDGCTHVWSSSSGRRLVSLASPTDSINSVATHAAADFLFFGTSTGGVSMYDYGGAKGSAMNPVRVLKKRHGREAAPRNTDATDFLAASSNGRLWVGTGYEQSSKCGVVESYDLNASSPTSAIGTLLFTKRNFGSAGVTAMRISRDGLRLSIGTGAVHESFRSGGDGILRVLDVSMRAAADADGLRISTPIYDVDWVDSAGFFVAAGDTRDNRVHVYDSRQTATSLFTHSHGLPAISSECNVIGQFLSPSHGAYDLVTGGQDGRLAFWDFSRADPVTIVDDSFGSPITAISTPPEHTNGSSVRTIPSLWVGTDCGHIHLYTPSRHLASRISPSSVATSYRTTV